MQVPEKLSLIGGSILLASTLVFTLKSQASQILPKATRPISIIYHDVSDTQKSSDFDNNFKQAQQKHWTTGTWGTAKYYIDKNDDLHIGQGQIQGHLLDILDDSKISNLNTINIDQSIQAPKQSDGLFAGSNSSKVTQINGLSNLNTSQVTSMSGMFAHNASLKSIDPSQININSANNLSYMFGDDDSLQYIDLSPWDMSNISNTHEMLQNQKSLSKITLGKQDHLNSLSGLTGKNWVSGKQDLNSVAMQNSQAHPGTWIIQSYGS